MTFTAVLLAATQPLEWDGETSVADRLASQLRALGATAVHVIGADLRAIAALAADGTDDLVLAHADLVLHTQALAALLADDRLGSAVLSAPIGGAGALEPPLRVRRGRVTSAGSPFHGVRAPNRTFLGVLKVRAGDRMRLAQVADRAASLRLDRPQAGASPRTAAPQGEAALEARSMQSELTLEPLPDPDAPLVFAPAARADVLSLLLTGLVRDDVPVGFARLRGLHWARPLTAAEVEAERRTLATLDEDRLRLDAAVKPSDGFFTTFLVSPYSRHIARWCARHGLTPNQVTVCSMLLGILAATAFATGERWGLIAGAVLLQAAFTLDCVDGQLARYTRRFSAFGAWLDSILDRSKEYVVYAGLAIGAGGDPGTAWALAGAVLALQTARHAIDFTYPLAQRQAARPLVLPPLEQAGDGLGGESPGAAAAQPDDDGDDGDGPGVLRAWRRLGRRPGVPWVKRVILFPIGERFAVISLATALSGARLTFAILLVWGAVALLYVLVGRLLRALRTRATAAVRPVEDPQLMRFCDHGPLARAVGAILPSPPLAPAALLAIGLIAGGALAVVSVWAGIAVALVLGALAAARPHVDRLRWLVPSLTWAIELGGIVWLGATTDGAGPATYALLSAIAFHHYDVVYRAAPRAAAAVAGGWDGRLAAAALLVAIGTAPAGLWVLAGALVALYAGSALRNHDQEELHE